MDYKKYIHLAQAHAVLSKDPATKVAALILGPYGEIRASGYNGAPRGCHADEDERKHRPLKYIWFSHAESNAIANAARAGTNVDECTIVVTHPPCMECAKLLVQAGIKRVVTRVEPLTGDSDFSKRWRESMRNTVALFDECGVEFIAVENV